MRIIKSIGKRTINEGFYAYYTIRKGIGIHAAQNCSHSMLLDITMKHSSFGN